MANYAEYINREDAQSNSATREPSVASGVTVYNRDFVGYDGAGRITSASVASLPLLGMVYGGPSRIKGRSQRLSGSGVSATGTADGKVKVLVVIEPQAEYLLKAAGALAATLVGQTFNLQGAAGSQLINVTPVGSDGGQFELVRLADGIRGSDNTFGVFRLRNIARKA